MEWAKAWDGVESRISKELKEAVATDKGKAGIFYRYCVLSCENDGLFE